MHWITKLTESTGEKQGISYLNTDGKTPVFDWVLITTETKRP